MEYNASTQFFMGTGLVIHESRIIIAQEGVVGAIVIVALLRDLGGWKKEDRPDDGSNLMPLTIERQVLPEWATFLPKCVGNFRGEGWECRTPDAPKVGAQLSEMTGGVLDSRVETRVWHHHFRVSLFAGMKHRRWCEGGEACLRRHPTSLNGGPK